MKLHHTLLVLLAALSGCQAPPLKPSALQLSGLHNIMVLAVEPPPLEVDPDPIETRQPLYRQSNNWPYDQFLEKKIYRNPGGVLIAGLVSRDDAVTFPACPTADYPANDAGGLGAVAELRDNWTPTLELALETTAQLQAAGVKTVSSRHYCRLPLAASDRAANLALWRGAVRRWYEQDASPIDYLSYARDGVDAALEIGIGTYRLFNGQMSLQLLAKLVDPATGRVIGRTATEDYSAPADGTADPLDHEAEKFRQAVRETGARLIARGLGELGLASAPTAARGVAPNYRASLTANAGTTP
ncbi:hypothetical protein [Methylogaea oryzae]|uniref:Lipoprotein n=1 Tax=Methylogaea oryzae TaxID=1295382 RepID=A0A8D4VQ75_9GAMM|nr:hypothetical protein [Methylogaea oryzae]BBL71334.1 hypothetical protein MoryE10_19400 [Methylogaea oryzae]